MALADHVLLQPSEDKHFLLQTVVAVEIPNSCLENPHLICGNVLHLWWDIPAPLLLGPSLKMNVLSKAV